MTINRDKIEVSTMNSVIALIVGIASIVAVFYNAKAEASDKVNAVSERVAILETSIPTIKDDIKDIKNSLSSVNELVRMVKSSYPKY